MNVIEIPVTPCIDVPLALGESPVWDDEREVLWFVDIDAPALLSFNPLTRELMRFDMPSPIGCVGLSHDGRLITGLKSGVHLFDPQTRELQFLVNPEADRPDNRLNDGKVGPDGCFWVGSMDQNSINTTGALYRVTPEGQCTRVLDNLFVSNGLAWSPDHRTLYHTDGTTSAINAYDFNPVSGELSNRRVLVTLDYEQTGWPDGAAMDSAGHYWSAGIYRGMINQISADGQLLRSLQMPVQGTTMACFGGKDGRTLFITSLTVELDDQEQAGTLLSCELDVQGTPAFRFGKPATPASH
ncbi:SMP-30/gluconolactonase/LRE family protein [Pseudomonas sp. COR18]|uniref:SMP-30/gluconolactonase/LRE family protein n=1 Tax=Pseudomonas sp. COR18 TaxID=3399680 RepID=UPI003AFF8AC3